MPVEYLEALDEAVITGAANQFGAIPYLCQKFDISREVAKKALDYWCVFWMDSFFDRHPEIKEEVLDTAGGLK